MVRVGLVEDSWPSARGLLRRGGRRELADQNKGDQDEKDQNEEDEDDVSGYSS